MKLKAAKCYSWEIETESELLERSARHLVENMTTKELQGIIEIYHKSGNYDEYFDKLCRERNTRI